MAVWLPPSKLFWKSASGPTLYLKRQDGVVRGVSVYLLRNVLEVLARLERVSGVTAELALFETELPNAFAIRINDRQVIALSLSWLNYLGHDRDALATSIGHELGHLYLRHDGRDRAKREEVARRASVILGTILNLSGVPLGGTIADLGTIAFARSFSRDEERAADEQGLKWAVAAGYDPCGRVTTMKMYQMLSSTSLSVPFLSTHPSITERSEAANIYAANTRGGVGCE